MLLLKLSMVSIVLAVVASQQNVTQSYDDLTEPAIWMNDLAKVCRPLDRSIDLLFILDGSGSNAGEVFATQMRMVNTVVDLIEVGANSTRIAILQYSGWTRMEFNFDTYMEKRTLKKAVADVTHFGGSTRTGRALDKAAKVFSKQYGARVGREDVAQVAVVVSDGRSIDDPTPAANRLRRNGVTVMTMGIGHNVFTPELEKISGGEALSFQNETMEEFLHTFKKIAIGEQCDYAKGPRGAEILCEQDSVRVNVKTNLPLLGHLYVSGFYDSPECRAMAKLSSLDADLQRIASLDIPLDKCGVQKQFLFSPRGLLFETTVVLKYHPDYNSIVDQVFSVRCFYPDMKKDDETEAAIFDESVVNTPHLASFSAPEMLMPCAYKVTNEEHDKCLIDMTRVGQEVTHSWQCDRKIFGTSYRILVHSCFMKNEKGSERMIINEAGCSIDEHLIATPSYSGDLDATVLGTAGKFPEFSSIKYKCSISFCRKDNGECDSILPPRCGKEAEMIAAAQQLLDEEESLEVELSDERDDYADDVSLIRRAKRQIVRTDLHNMPSNMVDKLFARRNFFFNPNAAKTTTTEEETETTTKRARYTFAPAPNSIEETTTETPTVVEIVEPVVRIVPTTVRAQTTSEPTTARPIPVVRGIDFAIDSNVQTLDVLEGSGEETLVKPDDDMHLMGLSEMIVKQIDFNSVELDSQTIQVHDLADTRDTGHSPVNWCPRDITY